MKSLRVALIGIFQFVILSLLLVGAGIVSSKYPGNRMIGYLLLITTSLLVVYFVDVWVKIMPALLVLATLASISTFVAGHVRNMPSMPVDRTEALMFTILLALGCVLSLHFAERRLHQWDRAAAIAFVASYVWASILSERQYLPLILGVCLLGIVWLKNTVKPDKLVTEDGDHAR